MSIRVNGKIIASNGDIKTEVSTDNLVTLDTNQTITSSKTFTIVPLKKSTTVDITVENPETYQQNDAFRVQDKNGNDMGWFGCGQLTSGKIHTTIHSKNKDGYSSIVAACVPQSGTTGAYAYAPNTPENAPDNAIVTVDYVNAASRGYLVESYRNGTEWYRVYSDGWIEQGGRVVSDGTLDWKIASLVRPFSDKNYNILISGDQLTGDSAGTFSGLVQYAKSTNSQFTWFWNANSSYAINWYACGY